MNKLTSFIEKYKRENPTGWRKWVFGAVVVLATLLVLAVYGVQSVMRAREMARLEHERDAAKQQMLEAAANAKLASDAKTQEEHELAAKEAFSRLEDIQERITAAEDVHSRNKAVIDSLGSWEDVDARVK